MPAQERPRRDAVAMGPSIGQKPGSQGTLFNMKPTDEHRYPRSYTPERMAEVHEALGLDRGNHPSSNPAIRGKRMEIAVDPEVDSHYTKDLPPQIHDPAKYSNRGQGMPGEPPAIRDITRQRLVGRRVAETIARSTMPTELLHQSSHGEMEDQWGDKHPALLDAPDIRIEKQPDGNSWMGHHNVVQGADIGQLRSIVSLGDTRTEKQAEFTLMHELGHHRSSVEDRPTSMGRAMRTGEHLYSSTPGRRGVEEARADRNVVEHYQPDPRSGFSFDPGSIRPYNFSGYPDIKNNTAKQRTAERAYTKDLPEVSQARNERNMRPQQEANAKFREGKYGTNRNPGWSTPHLFERQASASAGEKLRTETEADYGQFPLRIHGTEQDLGTITTGRGLPKPHLLDPAIGQKKVRIARNATYGS